MADTANLINVFLGGLLGSLGAGAIGYFNGFRGGRQLGHLEAADATAQAAAPFRVEPIFNQAGELERVIMHFKTVQIAEHIKAEEAEHGLSEPDH